MKHFLRMGIALASVVSMTACDGEPPLDIGRPDVAAPLSGMDAGRANLEDLQDAAVLAPPEVCPDPVMFEEVVAVHVQNTCAGGVCHSGATNNANLVF